MAATVRMVSNAVPWVEDYFAGRKWLGRVPTLLQVAEIRTFGRTIEAEHRVPPATILQQDNNTPSRSSCSNEGSWQLYFHEKPHSNEALKELAQPALDALNESQTSTSWKLPTDLPGPVLDWFQGQGQILFANTLVSGFHDVVTMVEQILQRAQGLPPYLDR